ncbi:universal stress protein [Roseinatronobacter alkalisoli]|uniref:Universal stress protein n=1 Tax=Roseinatronobacter alkalisoli TaxID=3028235 RepID=A0ABT5TFC5_9RHOB|nr:universal stress protein [Roseinatronobacter sp. HJB301]MDD7972603.1 universal stress protein [Roseinatronobacter sp. HJB301]
MPAIRTILVATDLKPRSAAVPERGAALARALGARMILVHATPDRGLRLRNWRAQDPDTIRDTLSQMAARYPDIAVETFMGTGPVDQVISDLARAESADLVVLGLHRVRTVLDTLRLTTMERIALAVFCPVLVAHSRDIAPYRRVLGAITFSPASAQAMAAAARIAPAAEFHAVHALRLPLKDKLPMSEAENGTAMTTSVLLRDAFMRLDGLPQNLETPEIVPGGVHEVLQFRINELKPDLIVIGSHSGRSHDQLGNYARDLMRAPPADLLIAKPD